MDSLGYIAPWVLGSVCVGILVGYYWSRLGQGSASGAAEAADRDRQATLKVLVEVLHAVEQMNGDVESHNTEIRQTADHVGAMRVSGDMENVQQALLAHLVALLKSNQRLQSDLTYTRYRMEEQAQEIDHARREARTDGLTAVASRKAFDEKLLFLLAQWEREGAPFVLMMVDLDHLKRINDSHGHPAGDHVLRKLGAWFKEWLREGDFVGRYGGDEFGILLPHTELAIGLELAEVVRAQVADRASGVTFRGEQVSLSLSIGVAAVRSGDTVESLVHRADEALYRSKGRGRNQVTAEAMPGPAEPAEAAPAAVPAPPIAAPPSLWTGDAARGSPMTLLDF